jgi:hypothetical protein
MNFMKTILITVYVLIVLAISATSRADHSIMPINQFKGDLKQVYVSGNLSLSPDGHMYLVVDDETVYEVVFVNEKLNQVPFDGDLVKVKALVLSFKAKPIFETSEARPLQATDNKVGLDFPKLLVLGIEVLPQQ